MGLEQSASTTSMEHFCRVPQVFGLALPYKNVSWMRVVRGLFCYTYIEDISHMLKAKITDIASDRVSLELPDGQTVHVPPSAFDGVPEAGKDAALLIVPIGGQEAGKQEIARRLLNELMGS